MANFALTSSKALWTWRFVCAFWSLIDLIFFSTSLFLISRFSMLLSTLSTVFSNYPLITGADFLIVLTSWSLCFPAWKTKYREWCIRGRCTRICSRNKNTKFTPQDVLRSSFYLRPRSATLSLKLQGQVHSYSPELAAAHKFSPALFSWLAIEGQSSQLFQLCHRAASVQRRSW